MRIREILLSIGLLSTVCFATLVYGQNRSSSTGSASARILSPLDVRVHWRVIDSNRSVTLSPRDSLDDYVYDFAFTPDWSFRLPGDGDLNWPGWIASPAIRISWEQLRVRETFARPNNFDVYVQPSFTSLPAIERRYRRSNLVLDAPCVLILNYY